VPSSRPVRASGPAAALARRRDLIGRRLRTDDRSILVILVTLTLVGAVLLYVFPDIFTGALLMVPLLLSEVVLSPRRAPAFVAFLVVVLVIETMLEYPEGIPARRWVTALVVLLMAVIILVTQVRRARLGVRGLTGDSMLLDLKERISRNGEIPELPTGWGIDVATRSAGDTSFAGDFMVAHLDGSRLTLVLVDVSGKGVDAGTRALLLSGAFGGLLGALPPAAFFPSANEFLNRQAWDEGFATAIQLSLDLRSGAYELRVAGHPPAIQFRAGSGLWHVHDELHGPILGVTTAPEFPPMTGHLGPGDALMLYTDGLVERPTRDIWRGIDKLIGEGERHVRSRFQGAAKDLVRKLGARDDDCALIILQRD
jgi:hypothetical protein